MYRSLLGEIYGTFILIFIGLGSILIGLSNYKFLKGTFDIPLAWGVGVALAIYSSRKISKSHLNPAVSLYYYLKKHIGVKELFGFWVAQCIGSLLAAFTLYFIGNNIIIEIERQELIIRGTAESIKTAMIFSEYYPNPRASVSVNLWEAFLLEFIGVCALIIGIDFISKKYKRLTPIYIGVLLSTLIYFIAPFTMCGLNPARDLFPRLVAYLNGWGQLAFSVNGNLDFFFIYTIAPILAAILTAKIFDYLKLP